MEIELKPCPFCGSVDINISTEVTHHNEYRDPDKWYLAPIYTSIITFKCNRCGCTLEVEKYKAKDAVEAWNRRANDG